MPSWWGKSSSKKKPSKESLSFIDTLHRKFKTQSEPKQTTRSDSELAISVKLHNDAIPEKTVARCQSFAERPRAQPLPLPSTHSSRVGKGSKASLFLPLPKPACMRGADLDGDLVTADAASVFSDDSDGDSDEPVGVVVDSSSNRSPLATDSDTCSLMLKDQTLVVSNQGEAKKPVNMNILGNNHVSLALPKRRQLSDRVSNLQIPPHGAFCSAPDSSRSSPSRSPLRAFGMEQVLNSAYWAGRPCCEVNLVGSGQCSSPGSGQNSGHNSMGGDMAGHLFWQPSRGSPEYSPVPSSRMTSPGPGSRIQSGAVTPVHPRAGGTQTESQTGWVDDGKQQSHRLPLPPLAVKNSLPFSHSNSAATSPSLPRSPGRADNPTSPSSHWKKGKLLGRGTFGHVYVGFNRESGEMCAMKEVTLFSDDAKSKESAKQLMQEITLLSRLRHPNIVQYYGSETVGDKIYIYLEYVAGGSIYKLLQEYGQFGELAIRSYTQQILSGLAYLHAKNTVHRDIKGANILVDTNGRVKLADFGMAKHISGQSCALSFKGSPYWMAPEVIKHSNGCNLAVDIWSLGCTVLEMATTKPPWSQYEGVAAMFKIGNSKELPTIPDHLSSEGKDFVRKCLQRNPDHRPPASELLDHPFVKCAAPLERPILGPEAADPVSGIAQGTKAMGTGQGRNVSTLGSDRLSLHSSTVLKTNPHASEIHKPRNISCPVSPIGSPLLRARSPHHINGRMSPSPISSPRTASGTSTPLNGGSGAIPFSNHLVFFQEGHRGLPKSSNTVYIGGPAHHDSNVDIFSGMQETSNITPELVPSKNDVLGKQLARIPKDDPYDVQSVLADRVRRQLLGDNMKINSSFDLSPNSSLLSRTNGL